MSPAAAGDPWRLGGRVRRAATPARLLARGATAAAIAQARALRGDRVEDIASDPKLVTAAEDIARELGEMKGAAMKIGQALSVLDVALIPEEYRSALSVLQADAPAMPYDHVVEVVTDELGAPPEELFDFFSPQPMAAASIGQVHMAHVGNEELVVKVQYPGVAKAVEADLRNAALLSAVARLLQRMTAGLISDVDVRALIDEVRDRISDELDYRIEAANQAEFADRFADDPDIDVPAVRPEWSTQRVLTTSYVDAMRWSAALEEPQELRDRWGRVLARFFATSLYDHGVVNVDTHPGNYLFHEDGRVAFLDFGCVTRLTEAQRLRTRRLAAALMSGDEDAILDAFVESGFLRSRSGFDADALLAPLANWMRGPRGPQPFRYSREMLADIIAESMRLRVGVNELKLLQRIDVPREHALLGRMSLGTEAVLAHLEATVDFREIYAQHLAGVLDVEPSWPDRSDAEPPPGGRVASSAVHLLAVDVGNTQTVIGLYALDQTTGPVTDPANRVADSDLLDHWRIATNVERTADEYALLFQEFLAFHGFGWPEDVTGFAVCSSVPRVTGSLRRFSERYLGQEALVVEPGVKTGMPILYDNPREVGSDRIADAVGAWDLYGGPTIVIDFGTATTFEAISSKGEYLGGAIFPGIDISLDALFGRAAALRRVELVEPENVIGRSTVESMQSGAVYGYTAVVDGMVHRFEDELAASATVVATGGLSGLIAPLSETIDHHEPWLTLHGLRIIHEKNAI